MQKLEIFKPGKHTAMSGASISFSEGDLAASAKAYDPAIHEAPIVIGHPKADAPAYGWVKALSFADSRLLAESHQVDPAFAELVREGKYKKLSASFYRPEAPQNPVPGVYYLRHVGFLGAMPPAVKGLKSASFADSEEGVIEFGDWSNRVSAGLWRGLREWFIAKFGIEEADKVIPGYSVDDLESAPAMPPESGEMAPMPAYSEGNHDGPSSGPSPGLRPPSPGGRGEGVRDSEAAGGDPTAKEKEMATAEELAAREAELKQKEADFAEREAKLKKVEIAARRAGHVDFVEGLVKEGKMLPHEKDTAVALLDFAARIEGQTVEFGETKQPPLEAMKAHLASRPKVIEYSEVATVANDPGKGGAAEKLEALTREKMKGIPGLGFAVAFAEVQTEHPDLALEYAESMRG